MRPTQEMIEWFEVRTANHIRLVQKYAKKIYDYDNNRFAHILDRVLKHDQSKFESPECVPYIFTSWNYRCKDLGKQFEITDEIKNSMNEATLHHIQNNRHHPEYFDEFSEINEKDRDAIPDRMVDATKMTDLDIAEMCADWLAMAEEKGNTAESWADKTVNKRWKFNDDQTILIYEIIKYY